MLPRRLRNLGVDRANAKHCAFKVALPRPSRPALQLPNPPLNACFLDRRSRFIAVTAELSKVPACVPVLSWGRGGRLPSICITDRDSSLKISFARSSSGSKSVKIGDTLSTTCCLSIRSDRPPILVMVMGG